MLKRLIQLSSLMVIGMFANTLVHAQAGYRICAVSHDDGHGYLTRGLIAKIAVKNGDDTCGKKLVWMHADYPRAYGGEQATKAFRMWQCESFSGAMGAKTDVCEFMEVNKIYKYSTVSGKYPVSSPNVTFWHN